MTDVFLASPRRREFLETNGVPSSAMLEVEMPLFLQTERNTGSCWVVMDDVSPRSLWRDCLAATEPCACACARVSRTAAGVSYLRMHTARICRVSHSISLDVSNESDLTPGSTFAGGCEGARALSAAVGPLL